jgi:type VI secretion system protein ImpI
MPPGAPFPPVQPAGGPADPDSWAAGARHAPPPPVEPPPVPTPRRPVYVASEPGGPWSRDASLAEASPAGGPPPEQRGPALRPAADPGLTNAASSELLQRLAQGARVPPDYFAGRDPAEMAELMGQLIRLVIEGTMQLLNARQQAKRLARTSSHTVIEAFNNNPLKFSPTAEDALRILFGPTTRSYLDAYSALAQGFDDLKTHQVRTYAAMQHALMAFLQDLDPSKIERESEGGGIAALVGSRKARLWDAYMARWQARAGPDGSGLIEAFMRDFAKSYDDSEA